MAAPQPIAFSTEFPPPPWLAQANSRVPEPQQPKQPILPNKWVRRVSNPLSPVISPSRFPVNWPPQPVGVSPRVSSPAPRPLSPKSIRCPNHPSAPIHWVVLPSALTPSDTSLVSSRRWEKCAIWDNEQVRGSGQDDAQIGQGEGGREGIRLS